MKKILGQTPTRASRTLLTIALSAMLVACGGGGGPAEVNPPPRFESITVGNTAAVRDNQTGIVWATKLGSDGLPSGYDEPTAAELLHLTDVGAAALRPYFGFVLDAASPLIKAKEAVKGKSGLTWAVDFGARWNELGGLSDEATGEAPDFENWYVLSRQSEAAGVLYPPVSERGTVTAAGLSWKFCTEGSTWVGRFGGLGRCTDESAAKQSFTQAEQAVVAANSARFDGETGWRLPTPQELRSLLQLENNVVSGNLLPSSFAGDPGAAAVLPLYWTSGRSADGTKAWVVDFSGNPDPGGIELVSVDGSDGAYVRLVRTSSR